MPYGRLLPYRRVPWSGVPLYLCAYKILLMLLSKWISCVVNALWTVYVVDAFLNTGLKCIIEALSTNLSHIVFDTFKPARWREEGDEGEARFRHRGDVVSKVALKVFGAQIASLGPNAPPLLKTPRSPSLLPIITSCNKWSHTSLTFMSLSHPLVFGIAGSYAHNIFGCE